MKSSLILFIGTIVTLVLSSLSAYGQVFKDKIHFEAQSYNGESIFVGKSFHSISINDSCNPNIYNQKETYSVEFKRDTSIPNLSYANYQLYLTELPSGDHSRKVSEAYGYKWLTEDSIKIGGLESGKHYRFELLNNVTGNTVLIIGQADLYCRYGYVEPKFGTSPSQVASVYHLINSTTIISQHPDNQSPTRRALTGPYDNNGRGPSQSEIDAEGGVGQRSGGYDPGRQSDNRPESLVDRRQPVDLRGSPEDSPEIQALYQALGENGYSDAVVSENYTPSGDKITVVSANGVSVAMREGDTFLEVSYQDIGDTVSVTARYDYVRNEVVVEENVINTNYTMQRVYDMEPVRDNIIAVNDEGNFVWEFNYNIRDPEVLETLLISEQMIVRSEANTNLDSSRSSGQEQTGPPSPSPEVLPIDDRSIPGQEGLIKGRMYSTTKFDRPVYRYQLNGTVCLVQTGAEYKDVILNDIKYRTILELKNAVGCALY